MTGAVPVPAKGQPMKASWAAAVAERVNALCGMAPSGMLARDGVGGMGAQPIPANRRERSGNQLHPFAVRWMQSANEGEGSWTIWLPSGDLLLVDGKAVDLRTGLTAADDSSGWYLLDSIEESADDLYLNVRVSEANGENAEDSESSQEDEDDEGRVEAEFASEPADEEDGKTVWPIRIACLSGGKVVQFVMSALAIGGGSAEDKDCVTSLNELIDDVAVIGGVGIRVSTEGNSIRISADAEKTEEDENPHPPSSDPCEHPNADGGVTEGWASAGGGVDVPEDEAQDSGGGGKGCCGGNSSTGSATGSPEAGASGAAAPAGTTSGANGKPASSAPSSGTGSSSGGSAASSGLFNGSTTSVSGRLGQGSTTSLYGGTHGSLASSNTMNQSPFTANGSAKSIGSGSTTPIYSGSKSPFYSNTHGKLSNSKTMNESPFKTKAGQK